MAGILPAVSPGDLDRDGVMSSSDIDWMMGALADPTKFKTNTGLTSTDLLTEADLNHDGIFTNADLQTLLTMLHSGNGTSTVPEPGSLVLAVMAFFGIAAAHRHVRR